MHGFREVAHQMIVKKLWWWVLTFSWWELIWISRSIPIKAYIFEKNGIRTIIFNLNSWNNFTRYWTRNNAFKLQVGEFNLNVFFKKTLTIRAVWRWNQLLRGMVFPLLDIFKEKLKNPGNFNRIFGILFSFCPLLV